MSKTFALTLVGPIERTREYRVLEARNTIAYDPDMILSRAEVVNLVQDEDWEIIIVPEYNHRCLRTS